MLKKDRPQASVFRDVDNCDVVRPQAGMPYYIGSDGEFEVVVQINEDDPNSYVTQINNVGPQAFSPSSEVSNGFATTLGIGPPDPGGTQEQFFLQNDDTGNSTSYYFLGVRPPGTSITAPRKHGLAAAKHQCRFRPSGPVKTALLIVSGFADGDNNAASLNQSVKLTNITGMRSFSCFWLNMDIIDATKPTASTKDAPFFWILHVSRGGKWVLELKHENLNDYKGPKASQRRRAGLVARFSAAAPNPDSYPNELPLARDTSIKTGPDGPEFSTIPDSILLTFI